MIFALHFFIPSVLANELECLLSITYNAANEKLTPENFEEMVNARAADLTRCNNEFLTISFAVQEGSFDSSSIQNLNLFGVTSYLPSLYL